MGTDEHTSGELGDFQTNSGPQQQSGTSTSDSTTGVHQTITQTKQIDTHDSLHHIT